MANKADLIESVVQETSLSRKDVEQVLDSAIDTIVKTLRGGDKLTISGFGTFSVSSRAARTGRNPQTGEPIQIAAGKSPHFKAGKGFKTGIQ